jgi:hypothetical protein
VLLLCAASITSHWQADLLLGSLGLRCFRRCKAADIQAAAATAGRQAAGASNGPPTDGGPGCWRSPATSPHGAPPPPSQGGPPTLLGG